MDAYGRELILKDEVFEGAGCALDVLNVSGKGVLEKLRGLSETIPFADTENPP